MSVSLNIGIAAVKQLVLLLYHKKVRFWNTNVPEGGKFHQ
jgi:hypothetical protein